jgi:tetratricopeptide (TPR) repeat protein
MRFKTLSPLILLAFLSFCLAASAAAQAGRGVGRIGGVVVDEAGKPVPSAKIVMTLLPNKTEKRETDSDKKGEWGVIGLGTGDWLIMASAVGYIPESRQVYVRQLERNPKIIFKLKKAQAAEKVVYEDEGFLQLLDQTNALYNEGKYSEAIALSEQFIEKNPKAYQAYLGIGDCYQAMGELDKAMDNYNLALDRAKEDKTSGKVVSVKALSGIGSCYLKKQDFEQAKKAFEQSLELSPEDEILAYNVGEIYFSNQQIEEALHYFELAAQIKPGWSDPYLKLGYVYLNKGDNIKAIENLEKFLALEPDSPRSASAKEIIKQLKK